MLGRMSTNLLAFLLFYFCGECASQNNLALGKPASSSSQYSTLSAIRNTDGNIDPSSFSNTDNDPPTFVYVDLEDRFKITTINLLRGTGCTVCLERWQDLIVGIGDDPPTTEQVPGIDFRVCHIIRDVPDLASWTTVSCSAYGRYVILFSSATRHLSVAEIEVYGSQDAVFSKPIDAVFNVYNNTRDVVCRVNILEERNVPAKIHCMKNCLLHEACVAISFHKPLCRLHYLHLEHYLGTDELYESVQGGAYYQKP